jgi:hypothetical protein
VEDAVVSVEASVAIVADVVDAVTVAAVVVATVAGAVDVDVVAATVTRRSGFPLPSSAVS